MKMAKLKSGYMLVNVPFQALYIINTLCTNHSATVSNLASKHSITDYKVASNIGKNLLNNLNLYQVAHVAEHNAFKSDVSLKFNFYLLNTKLNALRCANTLSASKNDLVLQDFYFVLLDRKVDVVCKLANYVDLLSVDCDFKHTEFDECAKTCRKFDWDSLIVKLENAHIPDEIFRTLDSHFIMENFEFEPIEVSVIKFKLLNLLVQHANLRSNSAHTIASFFHHVHQQNNTLTFSIPKEYTEAQAQQLTSTIKICNILAQESVSKYYLNMVLDKDFKEQAKKIPKTLANSYSNTSGAVISDIESRSLLQSKSAYEFAQNFMDNYGPSFAPDWRRYFSGQSIMNVYEQAYLIMDYVFICLRNSNYHASKDIDFINSRTPKLYFDQSLFATFNLGLLSRTDSTNLEITNTNMNNSVVSRLVTLSNNRSLVKLNHQGQPKQGKIFFNFKLIDNDQLLENRVMIVNNEGIIVLLKELSPDLIKQLCDLDSKAKNIFACQQQPLVNNKFQNIYAGETFTFVDLKFHTVSPGFINLAQASVEHTSYDTCPSHEEMCQALRSSFANGITSLTIKHSNTLNNIADSWLGYYQKLQKALPTTYIGVSVDNISEHDLGGRLTPRAFFDSVKQNATYFYKLIECGKTSYIVNHFSDVNQLDLFLNPNEYELSKLIYTLNKNNDIDFQELKNRLHTHEGYSSHGEYVASLTQDRSLQFVSLHDHTLALESLPNQQLIKFVADNDAVQPLEISCKYSTINTHFAPHFNVAIFNLLNSQQVLYPVKCIKSLVKKSKKVFGLGYSWTETLLNEVVTKFTKQATNLFANHTTSHLSFVENLDSDGAKLENLDKYSICIEKYLDTKHYLYTCGISIIRADIFGHYTILELFPTSFPNIKVIPVDNDFYEDVKHATKRWKARLRNTREVFPDPFGMLNKQAAINFFKFNRYSLVDLARIVAMGTKLLLKVGKGNDCLFMRRVTQLHNKQQVYENSLFTEFQIHTDLYRNVDYYRQLSHSEPICERHHHISQFDQFLGFKQLDLKSYSSLIDFINFAYYRALNNAHTTDNIADSKEIRNRLLTNKEQYLTFDRFDSVKNRYLDFQYLLYMDQVNFYLPESQHLENLHTPSTKLHQTVVSLYNEFRDSKQDLVDFEYGQNSDEQAKELAPVWFAQTCLASSDAAKTLKKAYSHKFTSTAKKLILKGSTKPAYLTNSDVERGNYQVDSTDVVRLNSLSSLSTEEQTVITNTQEFLESAVNNATPIRVIDESDVTNINNYMRFVSYTAHKQLEQALTPCFNLDANAGVYFDASMQLSWIKSTLRLHGITTNPLLQTQLDLNQYFTCVDSTEVFGTKEMNGLINLGNRNNLIVTVSNVMASNSFVQAENPLTALVSDYSSQWACIDFACAQQKHVHYTNKNDRAYLTLSKFNASESSNLTQLHFGVRNHDVERKISSTPLACLDRLAEKMQITRIEAIKFMTINPAISLGMGSVLGSVAEGKIANFVLLSPEIDTVYQTWVNGVCVHQNEQLIEEHATRCKLLKEKIYFGNVKNTRLNHSSLKYHFTEAVQRDVAQDLYRFISTNQQHNFARKLSHELVGNTLRNVARHIRTIALGSC